MKDQSPKKSPAKSSKPPRERQNVYLDAPTREILDNLVVDMPDVESRSAAIRFVCRFYQMTSQGREP